jgi:hypothetical protein
MNLITAAEPLQTRRDDEYILLANVKSLISSGMYGSEALASMCWLRRASTACCSEEDCPSRWLTGKVIPPPPSFFVRM